MPQTSLFSKSLALSRCSAGGSVTQWLGAWTLLSLGLLFLICNTGMISYFMESCKVKLDNRWLALAPSEHSINGNICYFYFLNYYYKIFPSGPELPSKLQSCISLSGRSGKSSNSQRSKCNSWPPQPPGLITVQHSLLI